MKNENLIIEFEIIFYRYNIYNENSLFFALLLIIYFNITISLLFTPLISLLYISNVYISYINNIFKYICNIYTLRIYTLSYY